jgi:hypothetical protein
LLAALALDFQPRLLDRQDWSFVPDSVCRTRDHEDYLVRVLAHFPVVLHATNKSKEVQQSAIHGLWRRAFQLRFSLRQLRAHGAKSICLLWANYDLVRDAAVDILRKT